MLNTQSQTRLAIEHMQECKWFSQCKGVPVELAPENESLRFSGRVRSRRANRPRSFLSQCLTKGFWCEPACWASTSRSCLICSIAASSPSFDKIISFAASSESFSRLSCWPCSLSSFFSLRAAVAADSRARQPQPWPQTKRARAQPLASPRRSPPPPRFHARRRRFRPSVQPRREEPRVGP